MANMKIKKEKVLVTGCGGYIGPWVVYYLKKKYEVVGIDINFYNLNKIPKKFLPHKFIKKDVRNINIKDLKKIDYVVHLAALSNDPMGKINTKLTEDINFKASCRIAKFAKKNSVKKFIFASSCSVYGMDKFSDTVNEMSKLRPLTEYAKSKVNTEKFLKKISDSNFKSFSLRNATAFGVSPNMRLDLVFSNLGVGLFENEKINILSDGMPWRPIVHIRDIARAAKFCIENKFEKLDKENYYDFNIGDNAQNYRVKKIAQFLKNSNLKKGKITILGKGSKDKRSYKVNFDKINKLGFKAKYDLKFGFKELKKWFRINGTSKNILASRKYIRLNQIIYLLEKKIINKKLKFN